MKVDGNPFHVNMIGGYAALTKKCQKKREREERADREIRFNPHWDCPFFKYCWEEGMKLPSVAACPRCSS
jgi:hypothetical protein